MKKFLLIAVGLAVVVALFLFFRTLTSSPGQETESEQVAETEESEETASQESGVEESSDEAVAGGSIESSFEEYNPLTLVQSVEITPDDDYEIGAFCRVYYDEERSEFLTTFGTGQAGGGTSGYVGGGEGGQGSVYKYYSDDLEETGESAYYIQGGGDLATIVVGDYLYHLTGGSVGWKLAKFDLQTWQEVDRVDIALEADEGANDQMLAYANGMLIASSAKAANAFGGDTAGNTAPKADPTVGIYTHHHAFDLDLNPKGEWALEDTRHANGSSLVFVDGVYQFVTTTAYFGDLQVLQYDEDWNYLGTKMLIKKAQWPQGTEYDEETGQYYIAYLAIEGGGRSETRLAVFDKEWNLLSNTAVTDYGREFFAGRPSVKLFGDYVYVTYDKESMNATTKEWNRDWQCQMSVYEK